MLSFDTNYSNFCLFVIVILDFSKKNYWYCLLELIFEYRKECLLAKVGTVSSKVINRDILTLLVYFVRRSKFFWLATTNTILSEVSDLTSKHTGNCITKHPFLPFTFFQPSRFKCKRVKFIYVSLSGNSQGIQNCIIWKIWNMNGTERHKLDLEWPHRMNPWLRPRP